MTEQHGCRHTGRSVPSCRHNGRDGKKPGLTCGNIGCDGIGVGRECRHNPPKTPATAAEANRVDDAVTERGTNEWAEINAPEDGLVVRVPTEVPTLTPRASRALFAILVELTDVPALDRLGERIGDDR